jgi:hypothetical protein
MDVDEPAPLTPVLKLDDPSDLGEERVVLAPAHVPAGEETGSPLANENRPAGDLFASEGFHPEPLGVAVAAVS